MTNREKYGEEILDMLESGNNFTVTKEGKIGECNPISGNCNTCLFNTEKYDAGCRELKGFWLKKKYIEKPKITANELAFLALINPIFKYIARDKNNDLFLYKNMPRKGKDLWICERGYFNCISCMIKKNSFCAVRWEDEEPWKIEDLLKLEVEEQ